ncbi:MAG: AMP nucleosidase [Chitinophagales bacterium]|nr:AMP nucleosidase [Bacteroidota bacterium]MCB9043735.1 AMP nucleosidase [Chitinophagales bacterium]
MKTREDIVANWLPRYTGCALESFGKYILLVNFDQYVYMFAKKTGVEVQGTDKPMLSATFEDISIINFGIGSPNAALIMDLLSAIRPKAALFLGKAGGLRAKNSLGDFVLPIAAIRGEGTSNDYFAPEIPALPAFSLQKAISSTMNRKFSTDYWTGTVYTTNRRVWEWDDDFKVKLKTTRAMAIDMETATLFTTGFYNKIPCGALLLITDKPMTPDGVKTGDSDKYVSQEFMDLHLRIGIESLREIQFEGTSIRHLKF